MTIQNDAVATIVATVLRTDSATAYAPNDPHYGIVVIPDELWLNSETLVKYVRIDGIGTRGYVTGVEIHTCGAGIITAPDADDKYGKNHVCARIRDAINAVILATA